MLKRWLEHSATQQIQAGEYGHREPGSESERYVIGQLSSMGCIPVPQVGVAGVRIDVGVRHANWPYGFIIGMQRNGASYHSSRSARGRDRLREHY